MLNIAIMIYSHCGTLNYEIKEKKYEQIFNSTGYIDWISIWRS